MKALETLRANFVTQMEAVTKSLKTKHEEITRLEVKMEQLKGAIYAMDEALKTLSETTGEVTNG
jgi:peptidoglycan hydrolase CwlO-like protein